MLEKDTTEEILRWQRRNDMVYSWIINSLDPEIASSVIYIDLASEVWMELKERFSQGNDPRIFNPQINIFSYSRSEYCHGLFHKAERTLG